MGFSVLKFCIGVLGYLRVHKKLMKTMQTIRKFYRVKRAQIAYLRFIFEAYDGVANITTLDASTGTIVINIAPDRIKTALAVVEDMAKKMLIEELPKQLFQKSLGTE